MSALASSVFSFCMSALTTFSCAPAMNRFTRWLSFFTLPYSSSICACVSSPVNTFSAPPPSCLPRLKPSLYFSCIFDCSVLSAHSRSAFSCCVAWLANVSVVFLSAFAVSSACSCCLTSVFTLVLRSSSVFLSAFAVSSACSCCLTSVFTLVLRSSSVFLSAFAVSSACSFADIGAVAWLIAPMTCVCVCSVLSAHVRKSLSCFVACSANASVVFLSAFVVSSVCSFAASGSVPALTAAVTCACVWYCAFSFVHK